MGGNTPDDSHSNVSNGHSVSAGNHNDRATHTDSTASG